MNHDADGNPSGSCNWGSPAQVDPTDAAYTLATGGRGMHMFARRFWLRLFMVVVSAALVTATAEAQQKPNIILILSDDFGYGDSGPYGGGPGRGMPTPALDRISDEGMTISFTSTTNRAAPRD